MKSYPNLESKLPKETPVFLPGLNGLRAIAAISVVVAHVTLNKVADFGFPNTLDFTLADYAVTLFFVISGFLITYLLQKEQQASGNIQIKKFYIRRILRIWPLYYFYIFINLVFLFFTNTTNEVVTSQLWFYLFFAANIPTITHNVIYLFAHYWSIGVEEQFYLFWPWFMKIKRKYLLKVVFAIFILFFVVKVILYFTVGQASFGYRFLIYSRFNCMMIGAMGGILFFAKNKIFIKLFSLKSLQLIAWFLFFLIGFNLIPVPFIISHEIVSVASLCIIIGQLSPDKRLINLDTRIFDLTGKISYGIYIYHPFVIILLSMIIKPLLMPLIFRYIVAYLLSIVFSIVIAWLSYNYIEYPFLKLKSKMAIIKSRSSKY